MKHFQVNPAARLAGEITLPGDKSTAHRAIIFSALAKGKTEIDNFPANEDCLITLGAFKKLGIKCARRGPRVFVYGKGLKGLKKPRGPIYLGESGTSYRLLLGLLAAQPFESTLTAGDSLSARPMRRVTAPLRKMGAVLETRTVSTTSLVEEYPPIRITAGGLKGITYELPVASAQVKSAVLLAGLFAKGRTTVIEPVRTRDHTERMLKVFKARVEVKGKKIILTAGKELKSPKYIYVPGDISSAAFFMVAAAVVPDSKITVRNIGLNPSRTGVIKVLKRMGARIHVTCRMSHVACVEPIGDISVETGKLSGVRVRKDEIPTLIDELPVLMVAASLARGKSVFEGVGELRVKETDRIKSMSENLKAMGARMEVEVRDGKESLIIEGVKTLHGAEVKSFGDHRTAMAMVIAGLAAQGKTTLDDASCIAKSFPNFLRVVSLLTGEKYGKKAEV